jgi:hypothetical protein
MFINGFEIYFGVFMKGIIIAFFGIILFSACIEKTDMNNLHKNNIELLETHNAEQTLTDDKKSEGISEITIEDISFYIYNDLKPKWEYNGYEDLYKTYNITENNIIHESSIENWNSPGNLIIFNEYDCEEYKITISKLSEYPDNISFYSIEIEINEKNYLELFPYKNIEDYIRDNSFGNILVYDDEKSIIIYIFRYGEDDRIGYSDLIFENGILKAIRIRSYFT